MIDSLKTLSTALAVAISVAACTSEAHVRDELLHKTPIGTSFDQVLTFCEKQKLKCSQSNNAGYLNQETGKVVGVRSIWTVLSEHKETSLRTATISAYWGFDKDGKLLDIWVWKTVDAP